MYYASTILEAVGFHTDSAATLATVGLGGVKVQYFIVVQVHKKGGLCPTTKSPLSVDCHFTFCAKNSSELSLKAIWMKKLPSGTSLRSTSHSVWSWSCSVSVWNHLSHAVNLTRLRRKFVNSYILVRNIVSFPLFLAKYLPGKCIKESKSDKLGQNDENAIFVYQGVQPLLTVDY